LHLTTPTVATLSLIPSGQRGILETLKAMSRFARDGKKSLIVRGLAMRRTQSCAQKDYACEVRALHSFVRDSIRYVQDIDGVETVQSAEKTLEFGAGDCDDKAVLLAALLGSIGHPTRFVAIGFEVGIYSHVYVETRIGSRWIALETTEPVEAGWEPDPRTVRARLEHFN
jgi:hypothetical protein